MRGKLRDKRADTRHDGFKKPVSNRRPNKKDNRTANAWIEDDDWNPEDEDLLTTDAEADPDYKIAAKHGRH